MLSFSDFRCPHMEKHEILNKWICRKRRCVFGSIDSNCIDCRIYKQFLEKMREALSKLDANEDD